MSKKKVFLDTTVLLSKEFGSPELKAKIKQRLEDTAKFSTTYTKMEINRTFLKDATFLHSLLVEEGDFHVVYQRIQKFPMTPRSIKRCLQLLDKITDKRQIRVADAITRLENLMWVCTPYC